MTVIGWILGKYSPDDKIFTAMDKIIDLTPENIAGQHICCAMADKKSLGGTNAKKAIIAREYPNGYRFKKLNVNGKVFIEYAPAEITISPVLAPGFLQIQCFWVSGKYKGQGWGRKLIEACLLDAQDKNGIVAVSSKKKRPFLADPKFLKAFGFEIVDEAPPYFNLWALKNKNVPDPKFSDAAKAHQCTKNGIVVYYTAQCPFTDYYVKNEMVEIAKSYGKALEVIPVTTADQAMNVPTAFPLYTVFVDGQFLSHEILTHKRFAKLFEQLG
ncbi:MAG: YoaP domain-containing protein [Salinivirgaceae bacterium]|jgi:GNAT superfamily N-acetyltransferase|nr:YoaP domain-containing protein [Salinivirgaceae bacterium]